MAVNPIKILKEVLETVLLTVTIDSIDSLGSGQYKLNSSETYYLRTAKRVTIDSIVYRVVDFETNSYVTVEAFDGSDTPVTASSFTIDSPLFKWGNPKMVSGEIAKAYNQDGIYNPIIWVVEISSDSGTLDPSSAAPITPAYNIIIMDNADTENWSIEDHYEQDIWPLNNYFDYFMQILKSRRDLFDTDGATFTRTRLVNFGDYIQDEGMDELIQNAKVTAIQVQLDIPLTISTCKDVVITPNCPPSGDDVSTTFNLTPTGVDTPGGSTLGIAALNSLTAFVGTLVINTGTAKGISIGNCIISNSDDSYVLPLAAENDLELPDDTFEIYLDGTLEDTVVDPSITNTTLNVVWT